MTQSAPHAPGLTRSGKYLVFGLGAEEYAFAIENVREIIPLMPITRVPRTPPEMLGVVNLRGKIIPVLDLHRKLRVERAAETRNTCVVVVTNNDVSVGVVVDRVCEVAVIPEAQICPPPPFGSDIDAGHLTGIATGAGVPTRLILAIDKILVSAIPAQS